MAIRITVIQLGQILKMLDLVCDDRLKYPTLLMNAITSRFLSHILKCCKQFYADLIQLRKYEVFYSVRKVGKKILTKGKGSIK